ncbi:MAG TPA: hypothetical protein VMD97_02080 [Candidatus Aquilonibacter sp.]|nr:hypothetical protein [Candidatus Aquilonibacter sp.]
MAPHETEKLDAILRQLGELRTELLGSSDIAVEKPTGRLPRLERVVDGHESRIRRIEGFVLMIAGALGLIKAGAWAFSLFHK